MPEASKVVVTPAHAGWRRAVGPVRTDAARDALERLVGAAQELLAIHRVLPA